MDNDYFGGLSNKGDDGYENVTLRATSCLFHLVPFVKCWQIFLELLVPKGKHRISEKNEVVVLWHVLHSQEAVV